MVAVETELDKGAASAESESPASLALARKDKLLAGGLALLGLIAAGVRFNDQLVGLTGDNAAYILLARALLTGEPYDNPEYPWGYPLALSPFVSAAGPDNILAAILWMKLLSVLLFTASLPLIYLLFRMRHGAIASLAAVGLFATNNITLLYANDVMSEIPYVAASFGALLYWQKVIAPRLGSAENEAVPWRNLALAGLLFSAAYYIRTVALALFLGAPLVLLRYRRWRAAAALGAGLALAALPWALFSSAVSGATGNLNYADKLLMRDPYNPALGQISSLGEFAQRVWDTGRLYVEWIFPSMLFPPPFQQALGPVAPVLAVLFLLGLFSMLVKRIELPEVYTVLFLLALFAWPWRADRFMLPVYPLMLHYAIEGLLLISRQVGRAWQRYGQAPGRPVVWRALAVALVILTAIPNLWLAGSAATENYSYIAGKSPPSGHTPDWQRYFEACRWLRENSPPGSVTLSRKSTLTEIYASRPSVLIPLIPAEEYPAFLREKNVSYIIEDAFDWSTQTEQYLRPALRAHPALMGVVYETAPPVTRVWQVAR